MTVHCIYNRAAHKVPKTQVLTGGSILLKTVLRICNYLIEKPVILIFPNFAKIV